MMLKGIALIFLLVHHLFYIPNGQFDDIHLYGNFYLVNSIGLVGKLCVALFVFLSGYGLTAACEKAGRINLTYFYKRRFSKLYLNYWLMWLLFVPVGILVFDRTLQSVYGDHIWPNLPLDFLGLLKLTGQYGYNATWWFYSCITILYLIFPFIIMFCGKKVWTHLIFWGSIAITFCHTPVFGPFKDYVFPFVLGCHLRNGLINRILPPPIVNRMLTVMNGRLTRVGAAMLITTTIIAFPLRFLVPLPLTYDTILSILIVAVFKNLTLNKATSASLKCLGKHSFNIFLFHTFIYYYYLPELIFWSRNPVVIFLTLLVTTLLISCTIEWGKKKLGYNRLLKKLNG